MAALGLAASLCAGAAQATTASPAGPVAVCAGLFLGIPGDGTDAGVRAVYGHLASAASPYRVAPRPTLSVVRYPHRALTAARLTDVARRHLSAGYFRGWRTGVDRAVRLLRQRARSCGTEPITVAGFAQGAVVARGVLRALAHQGRTGILDRIVSVGLERDPLAHPEAGVSFEHLDGVDASSSGHGAGFGRHSRLDLPGAIRHKPVTVEDCAVTDRLCSGRGAVGPKALRRTLAAGHTYRSPAEVARGHVFGDAAAATMLFHRSTRYQLVDRSESIDLHGFASTGAGAWRATGLPPGLTVQGSQVVGTPTTAGTWHATLTLEVPTRSELARAVTRLTVVVEPAEVAVPGLTRITQGYDGEPANGSSENPAMAADGSVVAFDSTATNLVAGAAATDPATGEQASQVYAWDRGQGRMTLLSREPDGVPTTRDGSAAVSVSPDGRQVLFRFVHADADGHLLRELYLADLSTGTRRRVPASYVPPWDPLAVHQHYDKGRQQLDLQLRNAATGRPVGTACHVPGYRWLATDGERSASVSTDGSVFGVVVRADRPGDYTESRAVVVCRTGSGARTMYAEWQRVAISGDGHHASLAAGAGVDGWPDFDASGSDRDRLHLVEQVDLRSGTAASPYVVAPLTWGEAFDDISETISWRGMGLAESSDGTAVAFGSADANLLATGPAQAAQIYLWRPQG